MRLINLFPVFIYLVIIIYCKIIITNSELDYCDVTKVPGCWNKSHVLCKPIHTRSISKKNRMAILDELNIFRDNLRRYQSVCNLENFIWSTDLEKMARETYYRGTLDYCNITKDHKNIIYFRQPISMYTDVAKLFKNLVHMIIQNLEALNPSFSWIISAYSREIGCAQIYSGNYLVCMINGIQLKYFNQSAGYGDECRIKKSMLDTRPCLLNPICGHHLLCHNSTSSNFINVEPLPMNYTIITFILHKIVTEGKIVEWDYDLQFIAERIVADKLTNSEKCLAREKFPYITAVHYNGTQYFRDQISNIDSIFSTSQAIRSYIGCASYKSILNGTRHFHLYCLSTNKTERHESYIDYWPIYLLVILTFSDIIAALVLLHCLIKFERKRLIFSFQ